MKFHPLLLRTLSLLLVLTAACGPQTPSPELQIRLAVASTLAAIPTSTRAPISTPFPSPTSFSLAGLFCEYQFCIGHPPEMAFFDVSAQHNPGSPSAYAQGILASYSASLFIQVMWQTAPGASDPQFLLDLILDKAYDARSGDMNATKIHNMNVEYTAITSTASPLLPFGGAGAWICGDRAFAWKAYTADAASAQAMFNDALNRFICNTAK